MADNWLSRSIERLGFVSVTDSQGSGLQVRESTATSAPARPTTADISAETALSIGAVYRSVSILVTSVAQMSLGVYKNGRELKTPALIKNPNVNDTASGFVQETVFSLAAYGEAFWRLYRADSSVAPASIKVLDPGSVTLTEDTDTGKVTYYVEGREVRSHQIKHLKLMRRPGKAHGLGPIQAAKGELTAALRLREFADTWFDTSGVPLGYLTTDLTLNADESAEFAEAWRAFLREHGGVGVLSQGLNYKHLALKPADAQFLEVQQAVVVAIARLFGIPQTYLLAEVTGTSNTYVNQQETNLIFLQTTLTRYMTEIEAALTSLLPRGQEVQFKEDELLRMSLELKTDIEVKQVKAGLRSVTELRAADRLPPLPEKEAPSEPEETGGEEE